MKTDYEMALAHKYKVSSDGSVIPGVTTVIGIMDKPALKWASAKIAAKTAVDNIDRMFEIASFHRETLMKSKDVVKLALANGPDEDVYAHWCRGSFDREWREKAQRGTRVHDVAERWVKGETVDVPMSDYGFVDSLESFFNRERPEVLMSERVVVHPLPEYCYGGRFDAIMKIDGKTYMVDFKTGGEYTLETAMQASAYMNASLAIYGQDGQIAHFESLPELDGARIVYLKEDGMYSMSDPFDIISKDEAFEAFTNALNLYRSIRSINDKLKEKR